ncbi:hypothetical protein [uncultured Chryseobacterium sp.]|uniref:hypothetical protein n=1 Tax=uncultured Chryseobacterium sp. TaxID=259322 RepID=UPI00260605D7|nr:hypothetical protein [uncultured Chryseobacterium sp.]
MNSLDYFNQLISEIPDAKEGKMFGCLCAKMPNGKSGMMLKDDDLIIKISAEDAEKNAFKIFTPIENQPMNGWFVIPFAQKDSWKKFAEISCSGVAKLEKKGPKKKK